MAVPSQASDAATLRVFATTRWSVVLAAGAEDSAPARLALETLCRNYWHPVHGYICRKGYPAAEAQDLTQEFFAHLIARNYVREADRSKGKFRGFLLSALDFFLAREWRRAHRQKRGGHIQFVSLDEPPPPDRARVEPADPVTPETHFCRQWALTTLKQALGALEQECEMHGKGPLFRAACHLISGDRDGADYATISRQLGVSDGAVRVAVHRLRQRYGELLRRAVAETVSSEADVDGELHFLFQVLAR